MMPVHLCTQGSKRVAADQRQSHQRLRLLPGSQGERGRPVRQDKTSMKPLQAGSTNTEEEKR